MFTFFAHLLRQRAPAVPGPAPQTEAVRDAPEPEDDVEDLVVLRHAVLNRNKQVAGYEFVQADPAEAEPLEPGHDHDLSFLKLLESVVAGTTLGKRSAFAAVAARLLFDPLLEKLARAGVLVLLRFDADTNALDLPRIATRMQALRSAGLRVGLADARLALDRPALGQAASLGFLPVDQISPPDLLQAVRRLSSQHPQLQLFASGVRFQEEFEVCRRLKMQGFTGPFATHRRDWANQAIDPGTVRLCALVTSLRAGAEMDRIIRDIKLDPLLSYRVLAYANSAGVAAQHKVQTLKDAILLIGREPLFRWLVLLLCASGPARQEDGAVLENALVRGRLMELLARQIAGAPAEDCFLSGVLSLLDVLLQQPASTLFQTMDLPPAVQAALLSDDGPCASLLRLVQAIEQGNSEGIRALCFELGIGPRELSQAQTDALAWARGQSPDAAGEAGFALEPVADAPQQAPAAPPEPEPQLQPETVPAPQTQIEPEPTSTPEAPAAAEPPLAADQALLAAAERGEPQAQCALGARYAVGDGVAQDLAQSLAWYTKAAQQGNANAQWNAAVMHAHGQGGIERNAQQAFVWCQQAADQGFAPAQATLGLMYSAGQGAEKDLGKALALLEQAALQGDVEAQYNLAVLQEQELEGEQNLKQALAWFAKAAQQGLPAAQDRLGRMYAMGQSCAPDLIAAYQWFFIASEAQHTQAQANLAHSLTLMQPEQVQEAEQRARRWMQEHTAATPCGPAPLR